MRTGRARHSVRAVVVDQDALVGKRTAGRGLPALPICGTAGTEAKAVLSRLLVSPKSDEGGSETQAEVQHHGKRQASGGFKPESMRPLFSGAIRALRVGL